MQWLSFPPPAAAAATTTTTTTGNWKSHPDHHGMAKSLGPAANFLFFLFAATTPSTTCR